MFLIINQNMAAKKNQSYVPITSCILPSGDPVQDCNPLPHYKPCTCTGDCDIANCDCTIQHGGCAYSASNGVLKDVYLTSDTSSLPVIECSRFCSCDKSCPNKASQTESIDGIYIDDAGTKGLGVFARGPLLKGTYVCEYVGQIVKLKEYEERLKKASVCYAIKVREHVGHQDALTTCIDASCYGNISRFINHSCSPNLVIVPVRSNCIVPRLCLFASRDVINGEELCFSYCDDSAHSISLGDTPCCCSSENCRKFLPLQV